jgi:membrane protein insertase Oxa1/YidC/SpoIIIJ
MKMHGGKEGGGSTRRRMSERKRISVVFRYSFRASSFFLMPCFLCLKLTKLFKEINLFTNIFYTFLLIRLIIYPMSFHALENINERYFIHIQLYIIRESVVC